MRLDRLFFKYGVYYPTVWVRREPLRRFLSEFERSQWTTREQLLDLQNAKLTRLLNFAIEHVPLYRERISPSARPLQWRVEDLASIPFLSKQDLREHWHSLRATGLGPTSEKTTGGSTGQAVTVLKTRHATAQELAAMWRGWSWAGVQIGDRQARLWGVPRSHTARLRARLVDFVSHRRRYSAFGFDEAQLRSYALSMRRFRPDFVYGYVSMLEAYAQFVLAHPDFRISPKAVIATSEVLTPQHRALIERAFEARVYVEYGCGEVGNIAHECDGGALHISSENLVVEVLPTRSPATDGQAGEVVVTELNNLAMPLIRYRLGDYASSESTICQCGRALPVLHSVFGRAYDLIYNREGKMFHGEFFMYIVEEAKQQGMGVEAFQIFQHDPTRFTVRVVPGQGYGPRTESFIRERIQTGYGAYAQIDFLPVSEIARESSGKLRLIIGCSPSRTG